MNAANDTRLLPGDVAFISFYTMLRPVPKRMKLSERHLLPRLEQDDVVLVVHVPDQAGDPRVAEDERALFSLVVSAKGVGYVYTENLLKHRMEIYLPKRHQERET